MVDRSNLPGLPDMRLPDSEWDRLEGALSSQLQTSEDVPPAERRWIEWFLRAGRSRGRDDVSGLWPETGAADTDSLAGLFSRAAEELKKGDAAVYARQLAGYFADRGSPPTPGPPPDTYR